MNLGGENYLNIITVVLIVLFTAALSAAGGYFVRRQLAESKVGSAEEAAKNLLDEAEKQAQAVKREKIVEAKEEVHKLRKDLEQESRERRAEFQRTERRLIQKEESLDKKTASIERKEEDLRNKELEIGAVREKAEEIVRQQSAELERLSNMTLDEAKELLLSRVREEVKYEMAMMIKDLESQAKEDAEKRARHIITYAIQKFAADHVSETTVSVVSLPNDEMKGRIIGREGRNIRTLETLTGIDLIIDDTPEAVILSGFDPIRREVARIALEKLVVDGRIHPARIEEMVDKARQEVDVRIREEGEAATFEAGVHGLHPELVKLLGRLRYRTSYGQNVLKHSIEVAHLAGAMAAELGLDIQFAKRAGLLHDIGKAVDHEVEGPHVTIGGDLAKKYKESREIVNAIAAHHGDEEFLTLEAVLIQAGDAVSAARPGARRETLETYIKRLEKLEGIAESLDGVDKAYAIQAGREVRIMVKPERVDDLASVTMAREIVKKIEENLEYPGQIKVTVIRETRAVDYAK
ncbi:MAG: ribonuclease Y [Dethiobacter sp.]|jgi:ribonuclease Y|nr:ribonuclease Y [Dethiobacter sp.]MBS3898273.1 ribonuclease Y [Dethiobacter sp.]MBS3982936.1 ribonuclease Y [Dethiobacter sp.]MCL4462394.1 ribonuclease Y [Bacillota bacterium]MCL5994365.1 ribonuclease Y [Bacillota bacterium]